MGRPKETAASCLRESLYTFEGEVEFLQGAARRANRQGRGSYVRWPIYAAAAPLGRASSSPL